MASSYTPLTTAAFPMTTDTITPHQRRENYIDQLCADARKEVYMDDPAYPAIIIAMAIFDLKEELKETPEPN